MKNCQRGIVPPHLLIILAGLGITLYFLTSSTIPFKDKLFNTLYPKPASKAAEPAACYNRGCTLNRSYTQCGGPGVGVIPNCDNVHAYDAPSTHLLNVWEYSCSDGTYWLSEDLGESTQCGGSGGGGSGWTYGCSGNACYDCILSNRHDVVDNYGSWGWDTSCSNQANIAIDWCNNLDYSGCQSIKQNQCASACGYSAPSPSPAPSTAPSCPASGDNCVYSAGDGKCYSGKTSDLSSCTPGYDKCFNPSAGCTYSCGPLTSCPTYVGGGGGTDPTNWIYCAEEGQRCSFSGTKLVRYGADPNYAYKTGTDGIDCNNGVFGDPYMYVRKKCWYAETTTAPSPSPTTSPTTSFNLEGNCNNGVGLSASWVTGSTGDKCNVHIYAGSTAYKISGNCTGTWTGNKLGTSGPTITNGGTYKLCVNNPGGNQLGCSPSVTANCSGIPSPVPTTSTGCTNPTGAEGVWRYECTTNTCSSDPTKGIGIPYRCESGQWVNKNPAGECTNQCKPSDSSPSPTPSTCEPPTCSYTTPVSTSLCPSGLYLCSGRGVTGPVNTPGCSYDANCDSCKCWVDPNPSPTPTSSTAPISGNTQNCSGKYNFNKKDPYIMCPKVENYADGNCDYVNGANNGKDQLYSILKNDGRLAGKTTAYQGKTYNDYDIWFNWVIAHESGFNPNNVNSWELPCGSRSNKGAFGFAQMGGIVTYKGSTIINTTNGGYDRGDKSWREQIDNFLNYQKNLGVCKKWNYWQAVNYLWNWCN